MKYFFDTEFIEHATGIQLVSIGIVCEDGRTFYAESSSFDARLADKWVIDNVLKKLKYWTQPNGGTLGYNSSLKIGEHITMFAPENSIKDGILEWIGDDTDPWFYAYFASYDWVVFARIFGRLIEKPKHFPMWVIDLKQMMWERGLTREWKQQACPDPEGEHDALIDAKWNMYLYSEIIKTKL